MKGHYLALIDENGTIKGGLPVYEVRSWLIGDRLVSTPFSTFSDPLVSDAEQFYHLLESVMLICKQIKFKYVEIRMFKFKFDQFDCKNQKNDLFKTHIIKLPENIEDLKKTFHKTCVRRNIKRAYGKGLKLRAGIMEEDWMAFYHLYAVNRKRLGLPVQPYIFIQNLWKTFSKGEKIKLLLAEWEGKAIGAIVLYKYKDRVSAEYLGSDEKYKSLYTNVFLYWEAIKWAHENKINYFDFGRTSTNNFSLMEFKQHWGTQMLDLPIYYFFEKSSHYKNDKNQSFLYLAARKLLKALPEHLYSKVGRFIYNHSS